MLARIGKSLLSKAAGFAPGGYSARPFLHRLRGVRIGRHVWISQYVYIDELHPEALSIGDNCTIGIRVSIFTHFYWGPLRGPEHARKVVIGNSVFVGPHCVILPGVTIGDGAVIKAGTTVSRDVPAHTLWGSQGDGAIARVSVPLTREHGYEEFVRGLRPIRKKGPVAGEQGRDTT